MTRKVEFGARRPGDGLMGTVDFAEAGRSCRLVGIASGVLEAGERLVELDPDGRMLGLTNGDIEDKFDSGALRVGNVIDFFGYQIVHGLELADGGPEVETPCLLEGVVEDDAGGLALRDRVRGDLFALKADPRVHRSLEKVLDYFRDDI